VISTQAASVEGNVSMGQDHPVRTMVLLAPDEKFKHVTSFYRYAASDDKGHYVLKGLSPGKYRLYTFDEFNQGYIEDPDKFLKPWEPQSVPLELKEGQSLTQNLTIPAPAAGANQ